MDPMQMMQQIMQAPNKEQMIQSMIAQNPQLSGLWQMAQQLSQNPNKEQVIQQLAREKGISVDEVKNQARNFGINI